MIDSPPSPRASVCALVLLALSVADGRSAEPTGSRSSAAGEARAAAVRRPFEGFWAADRAACRNPDSDERMAITRDGIDWYETHCRIGAITPAGRAAWRLDLACRGEGQRIAARATVSLSTPDRLTIDDGPIGPSRRQRYRRCVPR